MLSIVWILITVVVALLVYLSSSLIYTSVFFIMLGITGALALNGKWVISIVTFCCAGLLLVAAFYFEPGWFKSFLDIFSFAMS